MLLCGMEDCFGGHLLEPYEQNTQQSPDRGFICLWQFAQV